MEEHEIDRIAAAMHQLRPDWPVKSLKTMLHNPTLKDRPRRDVCVALAWVACEPNTATPGRVLESGPWWRATAVETANNGHRHGPRFYGTTEGDPRHICGICGIERHDCERRAATNGHTFIPRTECLPATEPGAFGKRGTCLAGPPDAPCQQQSGHEGPHDNPPSPAHTTPGPVTDTTTED